MALHQFLTFRPVRYIVADDLGGAFVKPRHALHVHQRRIESDSEEEVPACATAGKMGMKDQMTPLFLACMFWGVSNQR